MTKKYQSLLAIFLGLLLFVIPFAGCETATPPVPPVQAPPATESPTQTPPHSPPKEQPPGALVEAKVVRVIDGDTIEVSIGGRLYKVRYIGIDTPESVHPTRGEEPFGREASAKNRELVEGKVVRLEKDVSETDKYGRLLRYVYVGDLFVNAELVRLGYAQVATYPPDVKYQDLFLQLQREAREAGRGLWGITEATPSPTPAPPPGDSKYVGSIKSDKYHHPDCRFVKQIAPENLIWFKSAAEAKAKGYVPCSVCKPPATD